MKHSTRAEAPMQTKGRLYWKKRIADWRASKLSPVEYCSLHKIGKSAFYKWKSIFGYKGRLNVKKKSGYETTRQKRSGSKLPTFVKVNLSQSDVPLNVGKENIQMEVVLKNGRQVRFSYQNRGSEVAQLLNMLEALSC